MQAKSKCNVELQREIKMNDIGRIRTCAYKDDGLNVAPDGDWWKLGLIWKVRISGLEFFNSFEPVACALKVLP